LYYQEQKTLEKKLQKQAKYNSIGTSLISAFYNSIMILLISAFITCGFYALIKIMKIITNERAINSFAIILFIVCILLGFAILFRKKRASVSE